MTAIGFLLIAVVVSALGGLVLWFQHREPNSLDSGLEAFRREMEALAPPVEEPEPQLRRVTRPNRPLNGRDRPDGS